MNGHIFYNGNTYVWGLQHMIYIYNITFINPWKKNLNSDVYVIPSTSDKEPVDLHNFNHWEENFKGMVIE